MNAPKSEAETRTRAAPRQMGFKHAMLQRSYELAASPGPQLAAVAAAAPLPPPAAVQVTDFSISRILGGGKDNHVKKPSAAAPTGNILDLSKSSNQQQQPSAVPAQLPMPPAQLINPPAAAAYASGGYSMLPPDFLAMASATKFYAQFFPHLLPAYAAAAAAAGLATPPTSPYHQQHHHQQKRYFAPYVINGQSPTSRSKSSAPSACTRPDCLECLDYHKQFGAGAGAGYKPTPLISPAASSVSSSSSTRPARELLQLGTSQIATTNISLTTVTNLNLSSTTTTSTSAMSMLPKLKAVAVGSNNNNNNNTNIAEEISYKCRICDKVFGCSETLQVSGRYPKLWGKKVSSVDQGSLGKFDS